MDLHGRFCLLALQSIFCQYPRVTQRLLSEAGDIGAIFEGDRRRWRPHFGNNGALWDAFAKFDDWKAMERAWAEIGHLGARLVGATDDGYPALLKDIYDPPPALIIAGQGHDLMGAPAVAVVGARKASEHGRHMAASIACDLSDHGFVVISGMAYGIDAAAHRGALQGGTGTVAVFGCGLDVIYPPYHRDLAMDIRRSGLVVSEFPLGTPPHKSNFPQRNRVISGLCLATVVVEAAERSGSLITAGFALEQGRDVFAVPGAAGMQNVRGTNRLLRDGAILIESGDEVAEILAGRLPAAGVFEKPGHLEIDRDKDSPLLRSLPRRGDVSMDQIIAMTGMTAQEALGEIERLVLLGRVDESPGRRFRRREG